jgi:hypothetical protein
MAERPFLTWEPSPGYLRCDRAGLNALIAHTRPRQSGTVARAPEAILTLLNRPETGDAVRNLLRPVHECASQVSCVIATPDRLVLHRAWVSPENTTLLTPTDDVEARLTLIATGLLPLTLTKWVAVGPTHVGPGEQSGDPPGDRIVAPGVAEDLLSADAARRGPAFAITGAESAWDMELATSGTNLAMTIINTTRGHREIITETARTVLRPVTATTLFRRFTDVLAGLPFRRPELATFSNRAERES